MKLQRDNNNHYINKLNDIIAQLFNSNHNVRPLFACGNRSTVYYAMKYVIKAIPHAYRVESTILNFFNRLKLKELHENQVSVINKEQDRLTSLSISLQAVVTFFLL